MSFLEILDLKYNLFKKFHYVLRKILKLYSPENKSRNFSFWLVTGCVMFQCLFSQLQAQQFPLYSQYSFNAFLLNPAVAGAEGYTAVNLSSRQQWSGIEGAPLTNAVSVQTRIMKREYVPSNASIIKRYIRPPRSGKVGLGVYLFNDRAGQINQTGVQFTYAYHIHFLKSQLSFGATFSLLQFMINSNDLKVFDKTDDQINNNRLQVYVPDVNVGVYYTDQNKFVGLSILQLAHASVNISNYTDKGFLIQRNFYLTSGYKYELDEENFLEPSIYVKSTEQLRSQMDATIKYIYNRKFWVGLGYRTGTTFIGSLGINIDRFYAGYAYDYCPVGLNNSYGSHELMITLKLGDNVRRYKWIERY
jgi:type IX secretion system PorP/SprF family membrane protein